MEAETTVKARVNMSAVKIHGPNSPDVLSGRVALGHREDIQTEGEKIIEVTYEQACKLWGKENADTLFQSAKAASVRED